MEIFKELSLNVKNINLIVLFFRNLSEIYNIKNESKQQNTLQTVNLNQCNEFNIDKKLLKLISRFSTLLMT